MGDDNNCMKHYKKRLIYQHYPPRSHEIISEPTESAEVSNQANKIVKKKRKNCRSQFRHENLEIIKLGTNNNNANNNKSRINSITDQVKSSPAVPMMYHPMNLTKSAVMVPTKPHQNHQNHQKPPEIMSNRVPVICSLHQLKNNNDHPVVGIDLTKKATNENISGKIPKLYLIKDLLANGVKIMDHPKTPYFCERFNEPLTKKQEELLNEKFFLSATRRISDNTTINNNNLMNLQMAKTRLKSDNNSSDDFKVAKVLNVKLQSNLNYLVNNCGTNNPLRRLSVETSSSNSSRSSSCEPMIASPNNRTANFEFNNNRIPQGKLSYSKVDNCFTRYFDQTQKQLFLDNLSATNHVMGKSERFLEEKIALPYQVRFNDSKDELNVEEYVCEMTVVERFVPPDFFHFYKFVTGYQICNNKPPVSFLTFLKIYNTNGLKNLLDRYVQSLKNKRRNF